MKIVFFGDSITDMCRLREDHEYYSLGDVYSMGLGYVFLTASELKYRFPKKYEIINKGIGGDRIVDLYSRIKADVWNLKPDMLSILIGINDVWKDVCNGNANGVEIDRWEKIYRLLIEDTLKVLPDLKIVIMEPFVLKGTATEENFEKFLKVKEYAKVAKKIAEDYNCVFVPLQKDMDDFTDIYGDKDILYDGVHPDLVGAKIISDKWLKTVIKI